MTKRKKQRVPPPPGKNPVAQPGKAPEPKPEGSPETQLDSDAAANLENKAGGAAMPKTERRRPQKHESKTHKRRWAARAAARPIFPVLEPIATLSPPTLAWVNCIGLITAIAAIVFAISGMTRSIDDIKVPIYHFFGPALALTGLAAMLLGHARPPLRWVWGSLLAYCVIYAASTITSDYQWLGWENCMFVWSAVGLFLAGHCVGSWRRSADVFQRFLVVQLLLATIIGCLMFDFTGSASPQSAIGKFSTAMFARGWFANWESISSLIATFASAEDTMQSTILNRDFFSGYCCLFLPFGAVMAIEPVSDRHPLLWRMLGLLSTLLAGICILVCQSKGEYAMFVLSLIAIWILLYRIDHARNIMVHFLGPWAAGVAILVGGLSWMNSPRLLDKFKSLGTSLGSREIIWHGALHIFRDFPILGGGPGTFRIYFPHHRSPNYYLHEIANVTQFSHNLYLDQLCETGLLGFLAFMCLLGSLGYYASRRVWAHGHDRQRLSIIPALVGMVAILGCNIASPGGRWVIGASTIWTVLGFLSGLLVQPKYEDLPLVDGKIEYRPTALRAAPRFLAMGCIVVGLVMWPMSSSFGVRYFIGAEHYLKGDSYNSKVRDSDESNHPLPDKRKLDLLLTAEDEFKASIAANKHYTTAYYHLASVYSGLSRLNSDRAAALAQRFPKMTSDQRQAYDQLRNYSIDYLRLAMDAYETLSMYDPDYAEIHYNLGLVYDLWGRHLESLGGEYAVQSQQYREMAIEHLETMGKMSNKGLVALLQGQQYIAMGDPRRAVRVLREAIERDPKDAQVAQLYYNAARKADEPAEVISALEALFVIDPTNDDGIREMLDLCIQNKMKDRLQSDLNRVEAVNPVHEELFRGRTELAQMSDDTSGTLRNAELYAAVGGRDLPTLWTGVESALKLKNPGKARALAAQIGKSDPERKSEEAKKAAAAQLIP